jgi:fatty-acyl-CoA synthase
VPADPAGPQDEDATSVPRGAASAWARLRRAHARLRPLRLYERWETTTALMLATTTGEAPHRLGLAMPSLWRWRASPAGIVVGGAKSHPDRLALADAGEVLTYADLEWRTSALAHAWRESGIGRDTTVGLLCHNRAAFLEITMAVHKLGADLVLLNTGFAPPQVAEVVEGEGVDVVVHDDVLSDTDADALPVRTISTADLPGALAGARGARIDPPPAPGRVVVLTSGTTGRPKGAVRRGGNPLDAAAILTTVPIIGGDTSVVAAPLFHGLGHFMANLGLALGGSVVLRPRFDPELTLRDVAAHRATVLVAVPAMLQRILELPARQVEQHDLSSLRIVVCGGAALSGALAAQFMDRFGDVLYNVYGSTEVALATIATPRDLRRAPGTAGRPVPGVTVRVLDEHGRRVVGSATGRIFVGSSLRFDGYTGGGGKEVRDGLVATGDLGRTDRWGRLFVESREDDMIISGGENVFPAEVEDVLASHPAVGEAAVVGVPDEAFGQRLLAFVVRRPGAEAEADELKRHVHDRLARFKTPRDVVFLDALPRGATGKVLKRALVAPDAAQDHPGGEDGKSS